MKRSAGFPIFRALGGAFLVAAGVFAYYGVGFGASAILLVVAGGVVALVVALLGHRFRAGDFAIFMVGVLVLGVVTAGLPGGPAHVSYFAAKGQVQATAMSVDVSAQAGSISVGFTDRADVAYMVNFTMQPWMSSFLGPGTNTVTNSTSGGVFDLNVDSTWAAVSVVLGRGYSFDVRATTSTGSIDLQASGVGLGNVTLLTSTGSINAVVDASAVESLVLRADTGSVDLISHGLGAAGARVPITLATSTGSVSANLSLASEDAASLSASTSLGSISKSLRGFTITQDTKTSLVAAAGDVQTAPRSFAISATATLGSVDLNIGFG